MSKRRKNKKTALFLTVRELADLVPVSRASVYRLAHVLGKRVGRRLLVPRTRFERWLASEGTS